MMSELAPPPQASIPRQWEDFEPPIVQHLLETRYLGESQLPTPSGKWRSSGNSGSQKLHYGNSYSPCILPNCRSSGIGVSDANCSAVGSGLKSCVRQESLC
ncbi:hypothetical protein TNCV_1720791 [Trichonephila clavipes]|nr:hypothetical protein TNCV_1720791 [Trichonephila clavipes]